MGYGLMTIDNLRTERRILLREDARLRREGYHFDSEARVAIHRQVQEVSKMLKFKKHLASL